MAALNKIMFETWLAQQSVSMLEQIFISSFSALQQLNAGEKMNIGDGQLEVKFESGAFWNGVNQRALYVRGYLLIDPAFETSDKPLWANVLNQVPDIPADQFNSLFKIVQ